MHLVVFVEKKSEGKALLGLQEDSKIENTYNKIRLDLSRSAMWHYGK